jgi:hypothetical protein
MRPGTLLQGRTQLVDDLQPVIIRGAPHPPSDHTQSG